MWIWFQFNTISDCIYLYVLYLSHSQSHTNIFFFSVSPGYLSLSFFTLSFFFHSLFLSISLSLFLSFFSFSFYLSPSLSFSFSLSLSFYLSPPLFLSLSLFVSLYLSLFLSLSLSFSLYQSPPLSFFFSLSLFLSIHLLSLSFYLSHLPLSLPLPLSLFIYIYPSRLVSLSLSRNSGYTVVGFFIKVQVGLIILFCLRDQRFKSWWQNLKRLDSYFVSRPSLIRERADSASKNVNPAWIKFRISILWVELGKCVFFFNVITNMSTNV